jgi:hypothetical protein
MRLNPVVREPPLHLRLSWRLQLKCIPERMPPRYRKFRPLPYIGAFKIGTSFEDPGKG